VTPEQSKLFLECLGVKSSNIKADNKWLRCSCPLAFWTHQNHKDANPSFALALGVHDEPFFHCFSCRSGTAAELLQILELYASQTPNAPAYNFKQAHEILAGQELVMLELPEYQEFGHVDTKTFKPWPEEYLSSFVKATNVFLANEYLLSDREHHNEFGQSCRGHTPKSAHNFDLRYDHGKGMVVFPYRDAYGRLAGMRGRSITSKSHYDYTWNGINNASLVWFNEEALQLPGWVVVVEGQMDCMRVAEMWPKVVANLTAKPSLVKLNKLLQAEGTILIPDNDATGEASITKYRAFHDKHSHPLKVLRLPDTVKDADEACSAYLYDQITALFD
jgi:5S rRNA maturation endonuclease (ribonuclease M5)